MLYEHREDYYLCSNGIGPALRPYACAEDADSIAKWADSIQGDLKQGADDRVEGFVSGCAAFLSGLDLRVIRQAFLPRDKSAPVPELRARILCDLLHDYRQDNYSTAALEFAAELLLRNVNEATVPIYFSARLAREDRDPISWASFNEAHVDRLIAIMGDVGDESWAVNALKSLCSKRVDLAAYTKQLAMRKAGVAQAVLHYCVSEADLTPLFETLTQLLDMSDQERGEQPLFLLKHVEIDWSNKEHLFVKLLQLRDIRVALALFGGSSPPDLHNLGELDIGPIAWWLEWMMDVDASKDHEYWFRDQLAGVFSEHLNCDVRLQFVAEFNRPTTRFRQLLLQYVLPRFRDITNESFNDDTISFMLADLNRERGKAIRGHLLGGTATEKFVTERLLPLMAEAKQPLLNNLREILKQAGSRHGRRYILESMA